MNVELNAWSRLPVTLPAEVAAEMNRSELVDTRLLAAPNQWELASESSVGVVVADTWELRVHPKLEVPQLMFLLAYAHSQDGWRDVLAGFGTESQLLDAVANGFSVHCSNAFQRGLLRGYVGVRERRIDLRGRVLFGDQIARGGGLPLPIEVAYDDYTEDIAENRLLRTAADLLLRLPRIGTRARSRLLAVRAELENVSVLRDPRKFTAPPITRLNKRYEPALVLAELILRHSSVTATRGNVTSASFVFDLNKVFEDFVSTALREALRPYGGEVRFQQRDRLDTDRRAALPLYPDVTWWSRGTCLAVVDAKHKSIANKTMPNADAYQMLAYCTALQRRRGFLVYAKDSGERERQHVIRNSPYTLEVRVLDVELPPEALLREVDQLAAAIAASAGVAAVRHAA